MEVPISELKPDTLRAVVEAFVLREGTDYGNRVFSLEEKVDQVLAQLRAGHATLMFDAETETVNIISRP